MLRKTLYICITLFMVAQIDFAFAGAKIAKISGEVKVRRGVEEVWKLAKQGMILDDIDTILTGDKSEVVLELNGRSDFVLTHSSVLDISDLRKIPEKELFLFIMSKKIRKIEPRKEKTKIRIGNVSVVHGESKVSLDNVADSSQDTDWMVLEKNGAKALYSQELYPNTIIKFHKILSKYDIDSGEIQYYLGKSFEALNKNGQALDAYQEVVDIYSQAKPGTPETENFVEEAQKAIARLKVKH